MATFSAAPGSARVAATPGPFRLHEAGCHRGVVEHAKAPAPVGAGVMVPPAMLAATPSMKAALQAAMVAPTERRARSAIASLQGKPISRMSLASTEPSEIAAM